MRYKPLATCLLVVFALCAALPPTGHVADEHFPEYAIIQPNISFWMSIYTRFGTTQAVVHDNEYMDIVYDVIDLEPADDPGSVEKNRRYMKAAVDRYSRILNRLSADPSTDDADCQRVAALFDDRGDALRHANLRVRCQIGQQDRFKAGLVRSGAYIDQMRAILSSYGVPEDLAYLPHVESSFDFNAYSKFGAAGMWQFTRSTGKRFLTVNEVLDERLDPVSATHAAAQLLKENYAKLGSWPLAITAYNHGAAGMERAKSAHGDYPSIFTSYNGRTFKFASRNFYSEFLAARRIASDYQRYFAGLALMAPVPSRSLPLEGFAAFAELCDHFGMDPQILRSMNPALRPAVISGQRFIPESYRLHLPAMGDPNRGVDFAAIPADIYRRAQKTSCFYTVQTGDTAGRIARMHHVGLDDLILANNLNRRATVYFGQRLRIPQAGETIQPGTAFPATVPENAAAGDGAATGKGMDNAIPQGLPVENAVARYRRPGPAPAHLLALADIEPDATPSLRIDDDVEFRPARVNAKRGPDHLLPAESPSVALIQVDVEETIGHYAKWARVHVSQIRLLNRLSAGNPLQLHQEIKIPLDRVTADRFEARRQAFHKRMQDAFFAAYRIGELQQYRVQPGDSYWTLCREKFDLPMWLLKHFNGGVDLAALQVHQPLTIPTIESIAQENRDAVGRDTSPDA